MRFIQVLFLFYAFCYFYYFFLYYLVPFRNTRQIISVFHSVYYPPYQFLHKNVFCFFICSLFNYTTKVKQIMYYFQYFLKNLSLKFWQHLQLSTLKKLQVRPCNEKHSFASILGEKKKKLPHFSTTLRVCSPKIKPLKTVKIRQKCVLTNISLNHKGAVHFSTRNSQCGNCFTSSLNGI